MLMAIRMVYAELVSEVLAQQVENFPRLRMAPQFGLFENWGPVNNDLESALAGRDHRDFDAGVRLTKRGRQTGGPGLVVSNDAIFDRNRHRGLEINVALR